MFHGITRKRLYYLAVYSVGFSVFSVTGAYWVIQILSI